MKKENNEYWINFYNKGIAPENHSLFAQFVSSRIHSSKKIVDLGCGNGRDCKYLESLGHEVVGIDKFNQANYLGKDFINQDVLDLNIKSEVYYSRFFIHTLTENHCDVLLKNISTLMDENSLFFMETRSTKNITDEAKSETYFKSSIGEEHFRMLYSLEYLFNKLSKHFSVSYIEESDSFAPFNGESPFIIRAVLYSKPL
jgi:tellurite methyltransferase